MTRKQSGTCMGIFMLILLFINLPFLPGPHFLNAPALLLYLVGRVMGVIGLAAVPIGLIYLIAYRLKKKNLYRPVKFTLLFLAPLLSLLFLAAPLHNFSRNIAIRNGNRLITQINTYKQQHGYYPDTLKAREFNIPDSGVIGIEKYYYEKKNENFEVCFFQVVLWNLNFEIVTYNNQGAQQPQGAQKTLYATPFKNWKYEIFD